MVQHIEALGGLSIFVLGAAVGIVAIVFGSIVKMVTATSKERTRREIAAYIAEGTMSPEQGERLLRVKMEDEASA